MDFARLGRKMGSANLHQGGNMTAPLNLTDLPVNLLEALIPGYSIISGYILSTIGFDISLLVSIGALLFAGTKASTYLWTTISTLFGTYFMSSVHIDDGDDLYDTILKWIAEQHISKSARSIKAKSPRGSAWDEDTEETQTADSALDTDGTFNFGKWQAQVPPRYEPYYGRHRFWHKGQFFVFHRSQRQKQVIQGPWGGGSAGRDDDLLELSCIGRSPQPIKNLLKEIKLWSLQKQFSRTTIRNPTDKGRARFAGSWSKTSSRPSRPMATVILDKEQKKLIQRDMNEFLHPSSPKWYATRGIPYRRGYLFHGPPGTGKTSLSFALAGIFGLEIHCIALNDPELTEADLSQLFNGLPRRCIVLLEDIDEAGIKRDDKSEELSGKSKGKSKGGWKKSDGGKDGNADGVKDNDKKSDDTETSDKSGNGDVSKKQDTVNESPKLDETTTWTLLDLARALKTVAAESSSPTTSANNEPSKPVRAGRNPRGPGGGTRTKDPNNSGNTTTTTVINTGISLSGLLNAIDGVATHEGRILIMTTNHREKLDAALIRSGRVDMQIGFTYAKKEQIRELVLRMYAADGNVNGIEGLDLGGSGSFGDSDGGAGDGGREESGVEGGEVAKGAAEENGTNGHTVPNGTTHVDHLVTTKSKNIEKSRATPSTTIADKIKILEEIAKEFAEKLPDEVFAPSDIQGYLLMHKKSPRRALAEVEAWRDEQLAERRRKEEGEGDGDGEGDED